MAITKSAKKAIRQNKRRQGKNTKVKDKIKKLLKELRVLALQKKIDDAKKLLPQVYKALDKAAKTSLFKKNTVSRRKSRLTKLVNKIVR